jgi:hypothetical protein
MINQNEKIEGEAVYSQATLSWGGSTDSPPKNPSSRAGRRPTCHVLCSWLAPTAPASYSLAPFPAPQTWKCTTKRKARGRRQPHDDCSTSSLLPRRSETRFICSKIGMLIATQHLHSHLSSWSDRDFGFSTSNRPHYLCVSGNQPRTKIQYFA